MSKVFERASVSIQIICAVAIMTIVLYHFTYRHAEFYYGAKKSGYFFIFPHLGNIGVGVFFILAGFFAMVSLEKGGGSRKFFAKKFIRLYPPYLLAITAIFLSVRLFDTPSHSKCSLTTYQKILPEEFSHGAV